MKEYFKELVIAGTDEPVINIEIAKEFINAGTDILLIPAPYTIPHFNEEDFKKYRTMFGITIKT